MQKRHSQKRKLLSWTALAVPFFCFYSEPSAAQVPNNAVTYSPGNYTLQSESNLTSSVVIEAGSYVSVQNQTSLNFNSTQKLALSVDQNLSINGSNASLTVTNSITHNSQVLVGGTLDDSASGQVGVLSITNGGHMTINPNTLYGGGIQAGFAQGSSGEIDVSGQGSSLQTPYLTLGGGGSSVLNITNGASVTANFIQVGAGTGGSGIINVSDATLTAAHNIYTNSFGTGTINIYNAGVVVIGGGLEFGFSGTQSPINTSHTSGALNLYQGGILEVSGAGTSVQDNGQNVPGVIGANEGPGGSYSFNLAGGTLKDIDSGFATDVNATLAQNTNSTIDTNGYSTAFSGILSGSGGLTKNGSGTLILSGANTYTGGTTVNAGILQIGTAENLANYDTTANGPLTVAITPNTIPGAGNSPLQVDGTARLGGTLTVNVAPPSAGDGYIMGSKYQLATATNGISGTFSSVNLVGPYAQYLTPTTFYGSNEADIDLLASSHTFNTGHFYVSNGYVQNASLFDVLSAPAQTNNGYWLHGIGSFGHASGVNFNDKGFVIGRGFEIQPNLIIGGAISNVYTHTAGENNSGVSGTSFGAEGYSIYTMQKYTFAVTGIVGHLGNRATRYLPGIGAGKFAANGTYEGVSTRAQYDWLHHGPFFVKPYASFSYLHTHMGRGQETGLGFMNMGYGQINTNLAQAGGGLTGGYTSPTHHGVLTAWVGLGGLATLGNTHSRVKETVGIQNGSVSGQIASAGAFTPSVGLQLAGQTKPWKLAATWQGQISNRANGQNFTLQASYKF